MSSLRVVAIGASAGGVEPLLKITRALPREFPAAVCVVLHVPPSAPSVLPTLITRGGKLTAVHPQQREELEPGRIYVAPPDFHLLVRDGHVHLGTGPAENGSRPAIDPLFRSIADGYVPAAIGVVLSGALDDGTGGLHSIKVGGGITVVQDPAEALYPSMPQSALQNVTIDHVAPTDEIPGLLVRLVAEPAPKPGPSEGTVGHVAPDSEVDVSRTDIDLGISKLAQGGRPASPAPTAMGCSGKSRTAT